MKFYFSGRKAHPLPPGLTMPLSIDPEKSLSWIHHVAANVMMWWLQLVISRRGERGGPSPPPTQNVCSVSKSRAMIYQDGKSNKRWWMKRIEKAKNNDPVGLKRCHEGDCKALLFEYYRSKATALGYVEAHHISIVSFLLHSSKEAHNNRWRMFITSWWGRDIGNYYIQFETTYRTTGATAERAPQLDGKRH